MSANVTAQKRCLLDIFKDKHLPGCGNSLVPLDKAECRCAGPERWFLLEELAIILTESNQINTSKKHSS